MAVLSITYLLLSSMVWPLVQAALKINVTPSLYNIGLTKSLKVECFFSRDTTSSLTFLMSLSLSHSTSAENPEYEDLVSTNNFEIQVYGNDDNETEVYGAINKNDTSYLRVIWKYPNASRAGGYKCDANGLNSKRKPLTLSSTAEVTAVYLDSDRLVDELRRLTGIVESQNNVTEIKDRETEAKIQVFTNLVEQNQLKFDNLSILTMNIMKESIFISSPPFRGRRYWLTNRQLYMNADTAENFCGYFGGYLAEFDSAEEYAFIVDNLLKKNKLFQYAYLSGTDEEQEGVWRFHHSKKLMKFFYWSSGEPGGSRIENCFAYKYETGLTADYTCSYAYHPFTMGFICEKPE